jgi:hypothetical protein
LSTSLDNLVQIYPDLVELVKAWPELPEETKAAIKALAETHSLKSEPIKELKPHRMRHTYSTNFLNSGGSIEHLQSQLGHEHLSTKQICCKSMEKAIRPGTFTSCHHKSPKILFRILYRQSYTNVFVQINEIIRSF